MAHWQADAKERPSVTVLAMVPIVADWQIGLAPQKRSHETQTVDKTASQWSHQYTHQIDGKHISQASGRKMERGGRKVQVHIGESSHQGEQDAEAHSTSRHQPLVMKVTPQRADACSNISI
jgi:hypothetical protein